MKKLIISSDTLKKAIGKLGQAIAKNTVLPVLENIFFKVSKNEVTLITTDLELTIVYTCECEAAGSFEMLIPFDFLRKIVGLNKSQPITIEMKGDSVHISGEYDVYELGSVDKIDDFPKIPDVPKKNFIKLNGSFVDCLGRAIATVGKDELRPAMTRVCLDIADIGLSMVSTDAHVIFTHSFAVEAKGSDQLLVAPKIAKALEGFIETEIHWHKQHIAFKSENITVIATRHEDKYPDYKVVIPSHEANLLLDRDHFIAALERCCLNTDSQATTTMHLTKEKGTIHFEAVDVDLNRKITADINGSYHGQVDKITINAKKMLVLMHQVNYDKINLHIDNPQKAILISSENDKDYLGLIMPILITV